MVENKDGEIEIKWLDQNELHCGTLTQGSSIYPNIFLAVVKDENGAEQDIGYYIDEFGNAYNTRNGNIIDGRLGNQTVDAETEVLFILKESGSSELLADMFWFRDVVLAQDPQKGNNLKKREKRAITRYCNVLSGILGLLDGFPSFKDCAYINLNKIGGGSEQTKSYPQLVKAQASVIQKQIGLLHPKRIVCMGSYGMVTKEYKTDENKFSLLDLCCGEKTVSPKNDGNHMMWSKNGYNMVKVKGEGWLPVYDCWHPAYGGSYDKLADGRTRKHILQEYYEWRVKETSSK